MWIAASWLILDSGIALMGSCCFTPRKTHFLWWYWLLLASVAGIPMLLAALYVARHRDADEEQKGELGKKAARIFWGSAACFLVAGLFVGALLVEAAYSFEYAYTYCALLVDFFAYFLLAGYVDKKCRDMKNPYWRAAAVFASVAAIAFISVLNNVFMGCLVVFADFIHHPVIGLSLYLVAMGAAHFWRDFLERPNRRTAWSSLAAMLVAAVLFYGAARYVNVGHYFYYELWNGRTPTMKEALRYSAQ